MHKTMRSLFILFITLGSTLMVGCGSSVPVVKPFKMDIQQGNVVTSKMLLQLRPGMTKSQVKFIMGTPLVVDSFHTNRWDYFYQLRQAGKVVEQRRVILDFEKELLARVRGDVVPQGTAGADTGAVALANEPSAVARPVVKEGLLENLQFWKSNQEAVPPITKPEPQVKEKSILSKLKFWEKDQPVAKPNTAAVAESAASSKDALPAVIAPIIAAPAVVDEAIPATPAAEAEAPSMLAVPIDVAPSEPVSNLNTPTQVTPDVSPVVVAPTQAAPVVAKEDVAKETVADLPETQAVPETPEPVPANQEERFIFRFDRNLDVKNLQNAQTTPAEPTAKAKVVEEKVVPAEEPGYFERMLEKIGF